MLFGAEKPIPLSTGREWDKETGLYYYRARYYDPMEGRFLSKDPISFAGGDVNLYGYVQNNPTNKSDPAGLSPGQPPLKPQMDPGQDGGRRTRCEQIPNPSDEKLAKIEQVIFEHFLDNLIDHLLGPTFKGFFNNINPLTPAPAEASPSGRR